MEILEGTTLVIEVQDTYPVTAGDTAKSCFCTNTRGGIKWNLIQSHISKTELHAFYASIEIMQLMGQLKICWRTPVARELFPCLARRTVLSELLLPTRGFDAPHLS
jgi:hypothetical protein